MAYALNRVELIGNLGKDPEIRRTSAGEPIAHLRIATEDRWRDKNTGEQHSKTEWHNVVIFGALAKVAEQYAKKGSKIFIAGKLTTRKWQDQSGNERYSTEVAVNNFGGELILLSKAESSGRGDDQGGGHDGGYDDGPAPQTRQAAAPAKSLAEDLDDEIPF